MAISGKTYTDEKGKKFWMDKMSKGEPLSYEMQVNLSNHHVSIGDLVSLMEDFRFSAQQLLLLGQAAGRLGNAWITEMAFTEAIELEPDNSIAYGDVISFHAASQQWKTAQEFWEQAMLKATEKYYARYHYGRALFMQEKFDEALQQAQEGLTEVEFKNLDLVLLCLHSYLGKITSGQSENRHQDFLEAKEVWRAACIQFTESDEIRDLLNIFGKDEFEEE